MSTQIPFDNSYARLPAQFFTRQPATPVAAPRLIVFNHDLAAQMGITPGDEADLAQIFSGNQTPDGAEPLAQAYAGHQFGGFSPQLGDGRALLLGEVVRPDTGQRLDIQLKGSGPTPYSRMGDGRAWLGPVLREYLLCEAMHALGVPTTRALAAVSTGQPILREAGPLPGAILTRVAASHIRVGTFEYFAARRDTQALQALFDYTCARHYPGASDPVMLLDAVIARQAELVAHWHAIGFIHGVMNTDNTTLSGETIDYGPAAFMDAYHPVTVYSSIDRNGRYAYDNQSRVIVWNLAQLASALVPLMPDQDEAIEIFTNQINAMPDRLLAARALRMGAKLGLDMADPGDQGLVDMLLKMMQDHGADFTNTFRALAETGDAPDLRAAQDYGAWSARWQQRLQARPMARAQMLAANPAFIARNHRVEQMISAATQGDFAPFHRLLQVLQRPYDSQPDAADLQAPPQPHEVVQATFCGT
ncbi:MAG: YdiU family protein [Rhodobacteraceae bacterium]|nr:YdiU family protein [Paracoccaceae bacterium]